MAELQVDVHIFDTLQDPPSEAWLRKVAHLALSSEHPYRDPALAGIPSGERSAALGVVIADDDVMHTLNRDYHGEDEVTDALSFPLMQSGREQNEGDSVVFVVPEDPSNVLPVSIGEVIISYPQAIRQAKAAGHLVQQEVALLIAHGVLHLLGYDHATLEEEEVMWREQDRVLRNLFPHEGL